MKFVAVRSSTDEDIYVFQVEVPDDKVFETFDHSYKFFQCKSYGYSEAIPVKNIFDTCMKYPGVRGVI